MWLDKIITSQIFGKILYACGKHIYVGKIFMRKIFM